MANKSVHIRIAEPEQKERDLINLLTPFQRKVALVLAAMQMAQTLGSSQQREDTTHGV